MPIDQEILEKLLFLARLHGDEAKQQTMLDKLSHTLDMIDRMHEAPTEGVTPLQHPLAQPLSLRADAVTETVDPEALNTTAPAMHAGCFVVPRVLD